MLVVEDLTVKYSSLVALESFSIEVLRGEAVGLIGANGAGKSSAVNAVTGVVQSHAGSVLLDGQEVRGLKPHVIARAGLGRTFQQARLWPTLTIRENLLLSKTACEYDRIMFDEAVASLGLADVLDSGAATIAYGLRRLVEVLRAALLKPKVVLLDEPAAGLSPRDKSSLSNFLMSIRSRGTAILIIDHDMEFIRQTCDRLHVLESGRFLAKGGLQEVFAMPSVRTSYLGSGFQDG